MREREGRIDALIARAFVIRESGNPVTTIALFASPVLLDCPVKPGNDKTIWWGCALWFQGPATEVKYMVRVVGIDHLVISVGDFGKSKEFYAPLMEFLGFDVEAEYEGSMMGWANGNTLFWIAAADAEGKKHKYRKGDIGFHHYAFRLRSRADVDALQAYLEEKGATIVDPAGEYYDDYYAVFFLDPDGMKLEGMRYGERHAKAARARAARKKTAAAKRKTSKR
jgi:catechol 2,3-dioxygenase-like lactoylglutathione lyase family enzyme